MSDPDFDDPFARSDPTIRIPRVEPAPSARVVWRRWWPTLVFGLITFLVGGLVFGGGGNATRVPAATPASVAPRPAKTVTLRVPVPVAVTPESCNAAIQYTREMLPYMAQIIDQETPATQALDDAYVAVTQKNLAGIAKAQDELHTISNNLTTPADQYQELLTDAQSSMAACLKDLNK